VVGVSLLAYYGEERIRGAAGRRREMRRFEEANRLRLPPVEPPDRRLWSPQRIAAWKAAREKSGAPPLAILRIPKIALEVPVLEGTEDDILDRAVGHIADTSLPGAPGNCGIAGHRDGYFRGLKDVAGGDDIELQMLSGTERYRIVEIRIVDPEQTEVLDPTPEPTLTLVTCYPFYFVGSAPRRCIVRATRISGTGSAMGPKSNSAPPLPGSTIQSRR
jgi:sortase A